MSNAQTFPPIENAEAYSVSLTGYVLPWKDDAPVLMRLDGTPDIFLPLFSSVEKLRGAIDPTVMDSIKRVDDGSAFLDSLPTQSSLDQRLRIIADPHRTDDHETCFTEVLRDDSAD